MWAPRAIFAFPETVFGPKLTWIDNPSLITQFCSPFGRNEARPDKFCSTFTKAARDCWHMRGQTLAKNKTTNCVADAQQCLLIAHSPTLKLLISEKIGRNRLEFARPMKIFSGNGPNCFVYRQDKIHTLQCPSKPICSKTPWAKHRPFLLWANTQIWRRQANYVG